VKDTLELINRIQSDGLIDRYAIGGAVGATFYLAPAATVDLDIFVTFPASAGLLVSLSPIYEYLKSKGGRVQDEYIVIGDWPVQFLPCGNELEQEALRAAVPTFVEGAPTWVMPAEHLVAIALNTGRAKDHNRILQFIEQQAVDQAKLNDVLRRHGLQGKWEHFKEKFLEAHDE